MKIGIVGVSGYGGSELLRLCAGHPAFELAYVAGESTAGQTLAQPSLAAAVRQADLTGCGGAAGDLPTVNAKTGRRRCVWSEPDSPLDRAGSGS